MHLKQTYLLRPQSPTRPTDFVIRTSPIHGCCTCGPHKHMAFFTSPDNVLGALHPLLGVSEDIGMPNNAITKTYKLLDLLKNGCLVRAVFFMAVKSKKFLS